MNIFVDNWSVINEQMKFVTFIFCVFTGFFIYAQPSERNLNDTVTFIVNEIIKLENSSYTYKSYRLDFDDCNLEIEAVNKSDSTKWNMYALWLMDLDESKMRVLPQPDSSWGLILETRDPWKIKFVSQKDSGRKNHVVLFNDDRQELIAIGQAIYYGIKSCREIGRKSDY